MRAALICLSPPGDAAPALIAGRSAAQCQLELALAIGCEMVVAFGHGASPEAVGLRHQAEAAGVRFQTANDARALIGAVGAGDSLLVLQQGLWPEAADAVEALRGGPCLLVLPAGPGQEAGFERIDLDRAWAGAMVVPGKLVAGLAALPGDIAPASALLRVALQQRVPEVRLAAPVLDNGEWALLRSAEAAVRRESQWLRRKLGDQPGTGLSARIAGLALHRWGGRIAAHPRGQLAIVGAMLLALAGALLALWQAVPVAGFALLALACPIGEMAIGVARIRTGPFGSVGPWPRLRHAPDVVLAACAIMAIEGLWQRSLFSPLVLAVALLLLDRRFLPAAALGLRDRGVVALTLAVLVWIVPAEAAIMLVAGIVLCANLVPTARTRS